MPEPFDAVVVGGGPAGLSAALWLGRYRRRVVVFDAGAPRNEPAWAVHGYPGLVDPSPVELRRRLYQQAQGAGAEIFDGEIVGVEGEKGSFLVRPKDGEAVHAKRVVLAYGLRDYVPDVPGIGELFGTSVFHCADCDGPAVADTRIGVIGWNRYAANLALYLRHFTETVSLFTDGRALDVPPDALPILEHSDIAIHETKISGLIGHGGNITQAELDDGAIVRLDALFFHLGSEPRCELAEQIHCELDDDGYVRVDRGQETSEPGVHAAGDLTGHPHLASIAAAEGVRAALAIHRSLLPDWRQV